MKPIFIYLLLLSISAFSAFDLSAQNKVWSLQRCLAYAKTHNIQVKQQQLEKRSTAITLKKSQLSQLPVINASANYGRNFGRSIDPTTNQFASDNLSSAGANLNAQVTLFNFFRIRNLIQAKAYAFRAEKALLQKLVNDIALNVTDAYLQILLAEAQEKISKKKINLTRHQLQNTLKKIRVGKLPESEAAELRAQLARDSATFIQNRGKVRATVLQIETLLNLDYQTPFIPQEPALKTLPLFNLKQTSAADIFQKALRHQPGIRADSLQLQAAQKSLKAVKAGLYPTLSFDAQLGTNYSSTYRRPSGEKIVQLPPSPIGFVALNDQKYVVQSLPQNKAVPLYEDPDAGTQLGDNLRENIGISLSIPLFNSWQTRAQIKNAKINLKTQQLHRKKDLLQLKQQIYTTYTQAKSALRSYKAAKVTLQSSKTAFSYAQKRYNVGLINSVEYLTSQNHLFQAKTNLMSHRYNYIFKMKVLNFYRTTTIF